MQGLLNQRSEIINELNTAVKELKDRGKALAAAEKVYRIALAKEILILKDSMNSKGISLIGDLARGKEEIAELKLNRDIAETLYESAQQYIYLKKKELDVIEGDINAIRNGR